MHNWSQADLMTKSRILKDAEFSPAEIRVLMERGITGKEGRAILPEKYINVTTGSLVRPRTVDEIFLKPEINDVLVVNGERWRFIGKNNL